MPAQYNLLQVLDANANTLYMVAFMKLLCTVSRAEIEVLIEKNNFHHQKKNAQIDNFVLHFNLHDAQILPYYVIQVQVIRLKLATLSRIQ